MTFGYEEEDLHECCAIDCEEAGKHLLILKEWTGARYGGKTETGTKVPVASAYYCRNHMAKKLELLASRYGSDHDDDGSTQKRPTPLQYDGDIPL
jgi:hypothetical protein